MIQQIAETCLDAVHAVGVGKHIDKVNVTK
jgi:hypothetical protein